MPGTGNKRRAEEKGAEEDKDKETEPPKPKRKPRRALEEAAEAPEKAEEEEAPKAEEAEEAGADAADSGGEESSATLVMSGGSFADSGGEDSPGTLVMSGGGLETAEAAETAVNPQDGMAEEDEDFPEEAVHESPRRRPLQRSRVQHFDRSPSCN